MDNGYDFDKVTDRRNTNSKKWDDAGRKYQNPDIIPMWIADMDFTAAPCITEAVEQVARHGIYGYTASIERYKKYIIEWLEQENGWTVRAEDIRFAQTVLKAVSLIIRSLTAEDDAILVHTPCYQPFVDTIRQTRRRAVLSVLDQSGDRTVIDFAETERLIVEEQVRFLIFCNPHNPTGRAWTGEELRELVQLCSRHGVTIIADEIHSDIVMPGYCYTPMAVVAQSLGVDVITLKSPTKSFNISGLRIAYFITAKAEWKTRIDEMIAYNSEGYSANSFSGEVMKAVYTKGKPWLTGVNAYIYANYQYLQKRLGYFPKVRVTAMEATYLAWIDFSGYGDILTEDELRRQLEQEGVGIQTGSEFELPGSLYVRFNLACPREVLAAALDGTTQMLQNLEAYR